MSIHFYIVLSLLVSSSRCETPNITDNTNTSTTRKLRDKILYKFIIEFTNKLIKEVKEKYGDFTIRGLEDFENQAPPVEQDVLLRESIKTYIARPLFENFGQRRYKVVDRPPEDDTVTNLKSWSFRKELPENGNKV